MSERIRITETDLRSADVDEAVARRHAGRPSGPAAPPAPVPTWRRVLLSTQFYMPLAGVIGAVLVWLIIEPYFEDQQRIAGEIALVNAEPFDLDLPARMITVGRCDVALLPQLTELEPGEAGEPAYASLRDIRPGDVVEVVGEAHGGMRLVAWAVRPASPERAATVGQEIHGDLPWAALLLFPLTGALAAALIFLAEGLASRNWLRLLERGGLGVLLAAVFSGLAMVPAGILMTAYRGVFSYAAASSMGVVMLQDVSRPSFVVLVALRSTAWLAVGAGLGLGMSLVRATRIELRNSVLGGMVGGAVGGLFFDVVDRFFRPESLFAGADLSRAFGLAAVGLAVGIFVALGERLSREGWLRVRTGPLAGKSFVLYRSPTRLGSTPRSDIYLFKDAEIAASHAAIYRVGACFEIEDLGTSSGTIVNGRPVRRHRLASGDAITLGATVLEFEERAGRRAAAGPPPGGPG